MGGWEARADIEGLKEENELCIGQKTQSQPLSCAITLAQAILRASTVDFIVQKATELGRCALRRCISNRTVVQLDMKDAEEAREVA